MKIAPVNVHVRATSEGEPCTDDSRECVIASADTYLQALVSHDASGIRLAPDARRTENGLDSGNNAEEIRSSLEPPTPDETITGIRDKRWWVDGDQAVVYLGKVRHEAWDGDRVVDVVPRDDDR